MKCAYGRASLHAPLDLKQVIRLKYYIKIYYIQRTLAFEVVHGFVLTGVLYSVPVFHG